MSKYVYPDDQLPSPANLKLLALVGENKAVLEVGCALGYQTRAMRELQHCRITGIEIDAEAAEHARPYCESLIVGDIERLSLPEVLGTAEFDVITFADVLEHLRDPAEALRSIRPHLKADGYIVASIPNIAHASIVYELAHGRFNYQQLGLLDDTHIKFFTRETVLQTFERAGYLVISLDRTRVAAVDTEFKTQPVTGEDQAFLSYVRERNPEAETYKFIVKAIAANDSGAQQAALLSAQKQIHALQTDNAVQRDQLRILESQVAWLTNSPFARLRSALRKLF